MVRSPSPDELARLPCATPEDRRDPRYLGDAAIRWYRQRPLAAALADLEWPSDTPAIAIAGGIGRLVITRHGASWEPVVAPPRAAAPDLAVQRHAICRACDAYAEQRCHVAGCSCSGWGDPAARFSRCPRGRWPC